MVLIAGVSALLVTAYCFPAQSMPAQIMLIRHAEKFEDRQKINLNPRGKARAQALSQFFQSDPRVLEKGIIAAIIAQKPNDSKKSVRCEETVEPLAKALGQKVINDFAYGEISKLVEWLKSSTEWDSKSVLVCAQHLDIVPLAKSLGVPEIGQSVWPHETYDRVWVLDFSQPEGKLISFRDVPQRLLFGDSFQSASGETKSGHAHFRQIYSEAQVDGQNPGASPRANWKCSISVDIPGDFSQFDDNTIPMLRLGGFTFGYHATSLGKLKQTPHAIVQADPERGEGSLRYEYRSEVNGVQKTYATVCFFWNKEFLRAEFEADVDETIIKPDLNMPVECHIYRVNGSVNGSTNCYVAFGKQRFHAPAGLSYSGMASSFNGGSGRENYYINLGNDGGAVVKKEFLEEL